MIAIYYMEVSTHAGLCLIKEKGYAHNGLHMQHAYDKNNVMMIVSHWLVIALNILIEMIRKAFLQC